MYDDWWLDWQFRDLRKHVYRNIELHQQRLAHTNDADRERDDRLDVLEYNFARTLLLLQSIVEVGRRKQWFTDAELQQVCDELDRRDGAADGALTPQNVPGMKSPPERKSLFAFFRDVEPSPPPPSPEEFLKQLEAKDRRKPTAT